MSRAFLLDPCSWNPLRSLRRPSLSSRTNSPFSPHSSRVLTNVIRRPLRSVRTLVNRARGSLLFSGTCWKPHDMPPSSCPISPPLRPRLSWPDLSSNLDCGAFTFTTNLTLPPSYLPSLLSSMGLYEYRLICRVISTILFHLQDWVTFLLLISSFRFCELPTTVNSSSPYLAGVLVFLARRFFPGPPSPLLLSLPLTLPS